MVVFAISEITKSAMTEGMGISSSRGSFRIAYNASKILSLQPLKGLDGAIKSLTIRTEANRERGSLNALVKVDGVRMQKASEV